MRRLLLVPALALVLVGTPVLAFEQPEPPPTTTTTVPLTGAPAPDAGPTTTTAAAPSTTAPTGDAAVEEGWESDVTPVDATIVGVTWAGDPDAEFAIEVRSSDGSWSPAEHLELTDTTPDAGTPDAARADTVAPANATEPLWVGDDATAVRVTLEDGSAADVSVAAVDSRPAAAPSGAAGAITGELGTVDGAGRWIFGVALLAAVALLVALALGWRPRWTRVRVLGIAVGALVLAACVPVAPPPPPPPPPASAGNGPVPPVPSMFDRAAWGARPFACAGGPEYASTGLQFAVVHHTVNSNGYGPFDGPALVRGIQNYHMDVNGYCDIAYNFLVDRWGTIYVGRAGGIDKAVIGGHAGGFNTGSTGVALIGDFRSAQPQGEQWNALVNVLRWRLSAAHVDPSVPTMYTVKSSPCGCQRWPAGTDIYMDNRIWGHGDLDFTECPGGTFWSRRAELRNVVQAGISFPH